MPPSETKCHFVPFLLEQKQKFNEALWPKYGLGIFCRNILFYGVNAQHGQTNTGIIHPESFLSTKHLLPGKFLFFLPLAFT